ncbi:MAG: NAD(P)/FAD-dependent oxidoreductase [Pseudomonadota bacterium]
MTTDYDLVVVGGSFAGLICARTAAMRGLKVAVIDRRREPGAAVHTTGILVKEAAEEIDLPPDVVRRIHGVRLYGPSLASIDLAEPGYYFLATDTARLLRWLALDTAMAGAKLCYGTSYRGACYEEDGLRLRGIDITTRYLVGADGARSAVARTFGLGLNNQFLQGIEAHVPLDGGMAPNLLHCVLNRQLAPGYIAWAVPGVETLQVGLAAARGVKPDLEAALAMMNQIGGIDTSQVFERRAGLIPCGGPVRPFATDRVLLVGDAAGLVSPLTGGGIYNAFRFGRRAAQAVSDHLLDHGPEPSRVLAGEYPGYGAKLMMRRAMDHVVGDRLVDMMLKTPWFAEAARQIYFRPRGLLRGVKLAPAFRPSTVSRAMR